MDPKHDDTAAGSVEGIGLDRIASSGQNSVRAIVPGVCKCEILRLVRTDDHGKPLSKAATSCGLTQHDRKRTVGLKRSGSRVLPIIETSEYRAIRSPSRSPLRGATVIISVFGICLQEY